MGANSPLLEKYPGFGIDYAMPAGAGRIVNAPTEHEPEPVLETTESVPDETVKEILETKASVIPPDTSSFPVIPLLIAVISLLLIVCMIVVGRKMQKTKE